MNSFILKLWGKYGPKLFFGTFAALGGIAVVLLMGCLVLKGDLALEKSRHKQTTLELTQCQNDRQADARSLAERKNSMTALSESLGQCQQEKAAIASNAQKRFAIMQGAGCTTETPKGERVDDATRRKIADHINGM